MADIAHEKDTITHHEEIQTASDNISNEAGVIGFEAEEATLPKGYFRSRYFIGSWLAIGLGLMAGTGAFGYAAPILSVINADLGPDPRYVWVSYVYNCCLSVGLCISGRMGDIFGRRYIFIGGGVLAIIGSVMCATAQTINVLIGGNVFLGIASATQLSFHFAIGELVPMKYRYMAVGAVYPFSIAGSGMGPAISFAFVHKHPSVSWRGIYWFLLALNVLTTACWALFYFPPTFSQKHKGERASKLEWIKHFDYVGTFLFAASFVVFIMGMSWGGGIYPWKSAAVISAITLGTLGLIAFVFWEIYAPLREPLIPMYLFTNFQWTASVILLGLGAGVYYAFSIVWPVQCAVLYGKADDPMYAGYLSCLVGMGFITGQISAGLLAKAIGHQKWQIRFVFLIGGTFLGCAAVTEPDNKNTIIACIYLGCVFIGWNESLCLANSTILVHNQKDVGVAGGTAGTVRAGLCAVLVAIYVTVFTNRLTTTVSEEVPPALIAAGLPATSIADFLTAFTTGATELLMKVPGVTASVIAAGSASYKQANADAYRTVYLTTIAFSGIAVILTYWAPDTEKYLNSGVAATLHRQDTTENEKVEQV